MRYWVRSESRATLLGDDDIVLGRSSYCTLILDDASVSRLHARLRLEGDDVVLEDSGSRNGTFVNDARLESPTVVRPGDRILIGSVRVALERAPERQTPETAARGADEVDDGETLSERSAKRA